MSDLEDYEYPKIVFIGDGKSVRITHGWFFPEVDPNENAMYLDTYINDKGEALIVLDDGNIWFDFITPLKDYHGVWSVDELKTLEKEKKVRVES